MGQRRASTASTCCSEGSLQGGGECHQAMHVLYTVVVSSLHTGQQLALQGISPETASAIKEVLAEDIESATATAALPAGSEVTTCCTLLPPRSWLLSCLSHPLGLVLPLSFNAHSTSTLTTLTPSLARKQNHATGHAPFDHSPCSRSTCTA